MDVYLKDKPIKNENGFKEHCLVFGVQVLYSIWLKKNAAVMGHPGTSGRRGPH
jgi:hypothetical protein